MENQNHSSGTQTAPAFISGTFDPALPRNCVWNLRNPTGEVIANGEVAETERAFLKVDLPDGAEGDHAVHIHEINWNWLPDTLRESTGGLMILDNVDLAMVPGGNGDETANPNESIIA